VRQRRDRHFTCPWCFSSRSGIFQDFTQITHVLRLRGRGYVILHKTLAAVSHNIRRLQFQRVVPAQSGLDHVQAAFPDRLRLEFLDIAALSGPLP